MTSAALVLDEERPAVEPPAVSEPPPRVAADGTLRTGLALALIVVVQVAWFAALGYALVAFA